MKITEVPFPFKVQIRFPFKMCVWCNLKTCVPCLADRQAGRMCVNALHENVFSKTTEQIWTKFSTGSYRVVMYFWDVRFIFIHLLKVVSRRDLVTNSDISSKSFLKHTGTFKWYLFGGNEARPRCYVVLPIRMGFREMGEMIFSKSAEMDSWSLVTNCGVHVVSTISWKWQTVYSRSPKLLISIVSDKNIRWNTCRRLTSGSLDLKATGNWLASIYAHHDMSNSRSDWSLCRSIYCRSRAYFFQRRRCSLNLPRIFWI